MNTHHACEAGELFPCPFCGFEANLFRDVDADGVHHRVRCANRSCRAEQCLQADHTEYIRENHAIKAWNTRATESHLRAQLAEAEKEKAQLMAMRERHLERMQVDKFALEEMGRSLEHAQAWAKQETKSRDTMRSERDAAQARVGDLEGLLREAAAKLRHPHDSDVPSDNDLADRIDAALAALATSPHRLAGRGE